MTVGAAERLRDKAGDVTDLDSRSLAGRSSRSDDAQDKAARAVLVGMLRDDRYGRVSR
jgi:hypothetical protein